MAALGGQAEQKRQNYTDALKQHQEDATRSDQQARDAEQKREFDASLAQNKTVTDAQAAHERSLDAASQALSRSSADDIMWMKTNGGEPPAFSPTDSIEQMASKNYRYFSALASKAQAAGKPDLAKNLMSSASASVTQVKGSAQTGEIHSQTDLNVARTDQIKSWREKLKLQFDQQMKVVGAQDAARMQAAYAQANAALQRTNISVGGANARARYSDDEREAIALQAAINSADKTTANQNFETNLKSAELNFQGQLKSYDAQVKAAALSRSTPPVAPTFQPPSPNNTSINFSPTIVIPDGKGGFVTKKLPTTNNGATPQQKADPARVAKLKEVLQGVSPAEARSPAGRSKLKARGFTDADIDAATASAGPATAPLPKAPAQAGANNPSVLQAVMHMLGH